MMKNLRNIKGSVSVIDAAIDQKTRTFKVIGKKGTIIFADTSFIHRGLNIQYGSRYTYTNYYFENHPQRIQMSEDKWGKNYI